MKELKDYEPQELQDLSSLNYEEHRRVYKRAIREKAGEIQIPEPVLLKLTELEDGFKQRHTSDAPLRFQYGRQRGLSFIESYLIARFGEDPRVWPESPDWDAEVARLSRWEAAPPQTWSVEED